MRINLNINAIVKNIELLNYEMSVHTLSVCPGDQHGFWLFPGGIFEGLLLVEETPLLLFSWNFSTGFLSLQAWLGDAQGRLVVVMV